MKTIASSAVKGRDERILTIPLVTSETIPTPMGNMGSVIGEVMDDNHNVGPLIMKYAFIDINIPAIIPVVNARDLVPDLRHSRIR